MSESQRLEQTTISVDDIPPDEREEYLTGLPPARLKWAMFDAADRASTNGAKSEFDSLAFWLLQCLGWIGETAVATDLREVRETARHDIESLIPVVVKLLNREAVL